ncbi:hypothetical protein NL676_018999 [Syzygium grande]|nr:hypothetical protein NL676_018999 [Syzygium grande]
MGRSERRRKAKRVYEREGGTDSGEAHVSDARSSGSFPPFAVGSPWDWRHVGACRVKEGEPRRRLPLLELRRPDFFERNKNRN